MDKQMIETSLAIAGGFEETHPDITAEMVEVVTELFGWALTQMDNTEEEEAQDTFVEFIRQALGAAYLLGLSADSRHTDTQISVFDAEVMARLVRDGQVTITLDIT